MGGLILSLASQHLKDSVSGLSPPEIPLRNLIRLPTMWIFMKQLFEYRVVSGDLEVQIRDMAREGWRFVWAGHYDLLPFMVFERRLEGSPEKSGL